MAAHYGPNFVTSILLETCLKFDLWSFIEKVVDKLGVFFCRRPGQDEPSGIWSQSSNSGEPQLVRPHRMFSSTLSLLWLKVDECIQSPIRSYLAKFQQNVGSRCIRVVAVRSKPSLKSVFGYFRSGSFFPGGIFRCSKHVCRLHVVCLALLLLLLLLPFRVHKN